MSEVLIGSLNDRVSRLERENAELRAEAKKHRLAKRDVQTELESVRSQVSDLEKQRDQAQATAATAPDDWRKKYETAAADIRQRDHRDAWSAALNGQLAPGFKIDHVWRELSYQPGEAVPTPEEIAGHVAKVRESVPGFFVSQGQMTQPAREAPTQAKVPATQPPPMAGRGSPDSPSGRFVVTAENMRDPIWRAENDAKMIAAVNARLLEYRA